VTEHPGTVTNDDGFVTITAAAMSTAAESELAKIAPGGAKGPFRPILRMYMPRAEVLRPLRACTLME
jgi:hypothetical protein